MNSGTDANQPERHEDDAALDPEVLDRIKHPPAIDDAMREKSPEELVTNPTMSPEMLQEGSDLRDDLKRD